MVKTTSEDGKVELYLDGYMKNNLDTARERVRSNFDMVALYFGLEGSGKTTKALQDAYYLDPTICLDRIVFNPNQFEEAVEIAQPEQAIIWDEADDLGGHWASRIIRTMKRLFKRIRKKRLFIFLVTPTIFDLNKYFVIHRALFICKVYTDGLKRGHFAFYSGNSKRLLYMQGYKMWDDNAAYPDFRGKFTDLPKGFPIDLEAYEIKKDKATLESEDDVLSGGKENKMERICLGLKVRGWSTLDISDLTGYSERRVRELVQTGEFKGVFTGHRATFGGLAADNSLGSLLVKDLSLKKNLVKKRVEKNKTDTNILGMPIVNDNVGDY